MPSVISLSLDTELIAFFEKESKRLGIKRSQVVDRTIRTGLDYLAKRDSIGYLEIDLEEANDNEIRKAIRRLGYALRARNANPDLSTSTKFEARTNELSER